MTVQRNRLKINRNGMIKYRNRPEENEDTTDVPCLIDFSFINYDITSI